PWSGRRALARGARLPYTTLFRSPTDLARGDSVFKGAESLAARGQAPDAMVQLATAASLWAEAERVSRARPPVAIPPAAVASCTIDRKSTRLNSSHLVTSYAVFPL